MKSKRTKYYVQWLETHVARVEAPDEKSAIETALKKPSIQTLDSTERPIVIES